MKRAKLLAMVSITLGAFCTSAQAEVIAGWDFSQYAGAGSLVTTMGGMPQDTLSANYSTFDPTDGAGAEAAAFGTLYFDGSLGSTDVDEMAASPIFAPMAGSLTSNLNAPAGCCLPFDSFTELQLEGQDFTNPLSMTATQALTVVFEADLSAVAEDVSNFMLSFAGRAVGGDATVMIDYLSETSGSSGMFTLSDVEDVFELPMSEGVSEFIRVSVGFPTPGGGSGQVIIDNVAITATVPEPGQAGLVAASLSVVGLGVFRARRPRAA
jgi:hypothetical protein